MRWLPDDAIDRLRGAMDEPDLGETKYELGPLISRGGMGAVYRVHDSELDRDVALKVIGAPAPSEEERARMLREARILARLEHPGIVPIHDVGTLPDGRVFYVMKEIRGERLDARAGLSIDEAIVIVLRVAEAVAFAHARGVVHRDLKPENIMVGMFGEVLVLDWGVARWTDTGAAVGETHREGSKAEANPLHTLDGTVIGTPAYMAPEQARGEAHLVGPATDVYGLGAVLHCLLAGSPPSGPEAILPREVPRPLRAICRKALAADPARRYAGVLELASDLERFRARQPVSAHRESMSERLLRIITKYRTPLLIILAYLFVRLGILLWLRR